MKCNVMLVLTAIALSMMPTAVRADGNGQGGLVGQLVNWWIDDGNANSGTGPSCSQPSCSQPSCTTPVAPSCCTPVCTDPPRCYAEDFYCTDCNCGDCCGCCRKCNVFGSIEFLAWWAKGTSLPPLVTTSPPGTIQAEAGVLGFPNTTVLFGNEHAGDELQAGGRVTFGMWLDCEHNLAVGCRFFALGGDETRFTANSTDFPILAQPYFDAALGVESSLLLGFPNVASGGVAVNLSNRNVLGTDVFTSMMMERDCNRRIDLVFGYQFMRLDDNLQIDSTQTVLQAPPPIGTVFESSDTFTCKNEFHGVSLGLKRSRARGCWSVDAFGKLGVGNMQQSVVISGQTVGTIPNNPPVTVPGGLFAQPSNIGFFKRDEFCVIPELTLNLTYHVNCCLGFHVGYNFIWISDVALTGDQIDRNVNLGQPTPPLLPAFAFRDRDYWLQGLNFGMNWDF